METFKIDIEDDILEDLKKRLTMTRWPDEVGNHHWKTGADKTYLQNLCDYWLKGFDWKSRQAYLNTFKQFTTTIDGLRIHFVHHQGAGKTRIPLLLLHGYPDSFIRFLKVIPLLTKADENDISFDVVVPCMPGYGFSEIPRREGMHTGKIADIFAELMKGLGYEKFAAHGGDWGSGVAEQLALYHEKVLTAIHLTDIPFQHSITPVDDPTHAEKKFLDKVKMWQQTEGAYSMIQSTKPQSLAYGLNDSPAGLAGWITEKFYAWSDNHGDLESVFTKDELLTNITIYWATQTVNSSFRLYHEAIKALMEAQYNPLVKLNPFDKTGKKSNVPAAFAIFPKDISRPPREFAERFFNVKRWNEMSAGGHFAALEQPEILADDIRAFITETVNQPTTVAYAS